MKRCGEKNLKLTNKHNIPREIVRSIENDSYDMGEADISVTGLLKPPRISLLSKINEQKLEADVSDRIWILLGQATHTILERANENYDDTDIERRMFIDIEGWKVSGQADSFSLANNTLRDYKVTSAWSVVFASSKSDWEAQLNMYRYMYYKNFGKLADKLEIIAILRDWDKRKAQKGDGYPPCQVAVVDIPVWDIDDAEKFIRDKVKLHRDAWADYMTENRIPLCNSEDMWKKEDKYAVMKKNRKTALRVLSSEEEAREYVSNIEGKLEIVKREGECSRCVGNYCGVADFCDQYKKLSMEERI